MRNYKNIEEFFNHLEETNSDYPLISKDLSENPTIAERCKFDICQQIIGYKQKNNLTIEELAKRIKLDVDGAVKNWENKLQKDAIWNILLCRIDRYDLETLTECANDLSLPVKTILNFGSEVKTSKLDNWDESLNDQKIIEIVEKRINNKTFEPLPEPLSLWGEEVFFLETAYRGIKYRIIFCLKGAGITIRNIWIV